MFRSSTPARDIVLFEMIDRQTDTDGQAYLAALDDLASRTEPAILIFRVSGFADQDHEIRKQAAIWFKRNRDRLSDFTKGLIRVDEGHHHGDGNLHSHDDHDPEQSNFAKMLPFPVKHVTSLDQAFELAQSWPPTSSSDDN
jgi:hypothetical protein